jgi:hypothetical protein
VNDGGATSSAIGNILGGIAQEVGPEGAAKAALLQQQTQGADISNQDAYEKLLAGEAAANAAAGLTRTLNMNATDPGQPTVAGTVTSLSQPPSATPGPGGRISRIDESGFTPEQKYLANEIINGRLSPAALQTGVDVFSTPLVGAGSTPGAIRARSTTPMSPGQVFPSGPAATGGGGSSYVHAGDDAAAVADLNQANADLDLGGAATASLGKIDPLVDLYKTIVAPEAATVGSKAWQTAKEKAAAYFNIPLDRFDDPAAAKTLIKQQLLTFVGGLKDSAGNPFSPRQTQLIIDQIPDPDSSAFLPAMNWVRAHLQAQAANGAAAQHFLNTRQTDPNAGPAFRSARSQNAGAEGEAYRTSGLHGVGGPDQPEKPETPAPPAPPNPKLTPADPQTVQRARVKLQQAHGDPTVRQRIIDAGKANGVDLEAGGF